MAGYNTAECSVVTRRTEELGELTPRIMKASPPRVDHILKSSQCLSVHILL